MMSGLEQQHRARRFFRELGGGVCLQPSAQPMPLMPPDNDQVHTALARQSKDLHCWPAFANFDPGSYLRPEFTVGKFPQPLSALRVTGPPLAYHIQSAEGTWRFNYVEEGHLRPASLCQRARVPQGGYGGLGEVYGHQNLLLLSRERFLRGRRLSHCRRRRTITFLHA